MAPVLLNLYGFAGIENNAQKAYRLALNIRPVGVVDAPGDGANVISSPAVRQLVINRINADDLTWVNAISQVVGGLHEHPNIVTHTCFDYTRVYSLY